MNHNPYSPPQASSETQPLVEPVGESPSSTGEKVLAVVLVVGGAAGVGLAIWMGVQFISAHWVNSLFVAAFLVLFLGSGIAGVLLWRGRANGRKWSTILFAMQIPVLTVRGMSYEIYTGLSIKAFGGDPGPSFAFNLGANANFSLDPNIASTIYGVNIFALAAFIYLLRAWRGGMRAAASEAAADA